MKENSATSMLGSLSDTLATGFAWGFAAKQTSKPFRTIEELNEGPSMPDFQLFRVELGTMFAQEGQGIQIFAAADDLINRFPAFEDLREYLIDLCVLQLLTELEEEDEEALESPEWTKIEDAVGDRGSELLNMLIYIKDCKLNDVDPDLEDFLYEFLLADEEDFQDELAIYEPFVRNLDLIDGSLKKLILAGNELRGSELQDLFIPMMFFFREPEEMAGKLTLALLESSNLPEVHCAIYRLLCDALVSDL